MSNNIQVFNSPEFGEIRTAGTPDEPLFCAADICKALGYSNHRDAISKHVDEGDVAKRDMGVVTGKKADGTDARQVVSVTYVNESGLYALIFGSKLPKAKGFKRWVTSEVLPAIRRSGQYTAPVQLKDVPAPKSVVFGGPVADVRASLEWMQGVKELMGLGRTAMAEMVRSEGQRLGLPVPKAPTVEPGREPLSVSAIIKKWGLTGLKVQDFNQAMMREGGIAVRGGRKVLTGWGLDYGENKHSEQHPDVVWPVYYEDCFTYLCDRLNIVLSYRSGDLPY